MRRLTVQIPNPCHERWADMQPAEQGRFCASCQKTVVDYTACSDQELLWLLRQSSEASCGRFRNEQLNRPLLQSNPGNTSSWRHWVGLLTMSLFGWQAARAQANQANNPLHPTVLQPNQPIQALPFRGQVGLDKKWDKRWAITGRVMLQDSSGHQSPLPGATVWVAGVLAPIQTDSSGAFTLSIPAQTHTTALTARVSAPGRLRGQVTFIAAPSTGSITLNDIIVDELKPVMNITGGGIALVQTPSRWQKFRRKLFH